MRCVAVIDYGMGNLRSVSKALEAVADNHTNILVTADPSEIRAADHIVFPGVGAIRDCMAELKNLNSTNSSVKWPAKNLSWGFVWVCRHY